MTQHATPLERRDCGPEPRPAFATRGVVLVPEDLTLYDWPERAQRAGLTTIALHHGSSPTAVVRAVQSDAGQSFLERCRQLGLQVEYELHAMKELLPRDLFSKEPTLFRANDNKERTLTPTCVSIPRLLWTLPGSTPWRWRGRCVRRQVATSSGGRRTALVPLRQMP